VNVVSGFRETGEHFQVGDLFEGLNNQVQILFLHDALNFFPGLKAVTKIETCDLLTGLKDWGQMRQRQLGTADDQLFQIFHFGYGSTQPLSRKPVGIHNIEASECCRSYGVLLEETVPRARLREVVGPVVDHHSSFIPEIFSRVLYISNIQVTYDLSICHLSML